MLDKAQINYHKTQGNGALISLVNSHSDDKSILFILKNLGYLPKDFDANWINPLLEKQNQKIRLWSVKTLGKVKREQNLAVLKRVAREDESMEVRCEAVSSIGRIKTKAVIPVLVKFLSNDDPRLVLQAIRGLLVFKQDHKVAVKLKSLANHPNEIIQKVIRKEFFALHSGGAAQQNHPQSPNFLKNLIVLGDVREVLRNVPRESFHLTFTSPPYYNARDYSIYKSYTEYLNFLKQVFRATHQKTKEGRFLIVNTSPIIIPRVSRQHSSKRYPIPFDLHALLVKMGWEFIDDIVWAKPESSVKNRNAGFLQHRKPLGYKPNATTEYLMVYRKQTDKLLDWNIRQYSNKIVDQSKVESGYETSNVWKICPKNDKVHSAVFPAELCKRVIAYYSFKGDLIFDPFAGSGTFGRVAKRMGRFFFLTEQNKKYFDYMQSFLCTAEVFNDKLIPSSFITLDEFKKISKQGGRNDNN